MGIKTYNPYTPSRRQSVRSEDVGLLPICIADKCNVCCSVWIIFDGHNFCRDAILCSLKAQQLQVRFAGFVMCHLWHFWKTRLWRGFIRTCAEKQQPSISALSFVSCTIAFFFFAVFPSVMPQRHQRI